MFSSVQGNRLVGLAPLNLISAHHGAELWTPRAGMKGAATGETRILPNPATFKSSIRQLDEIHDTMASNCCVRRTDRVMKTHQNRLKRDGNHFGLARAVRRDEKGDSVER
jgi:hypothetical protein